MTDVSQGRQSAFQNIVRAVGWGMIGFALFATAAEIGSFALAYFMSSGEDFFVSWSLIMLAISLGISIGLLLTPTNQGNERKLFPSIGKALLAFLSGWLLSKIDGFAAQIMSYDALTNLVVFRMSACLGCFVLSSTCVYAIRQYTDWKALDEARNEPGPAVRRTFVLTEIDSVAHANVSVEKADGVRPQAPPPSPSNVQ